MSPEDTRHELEYLHFHKKTGEVGFPSAEAGREHASGKTNCCPINPRVSGSTGNEIICRMAVTLQGAREVTCQAILVEVQLPHRHKRPKLPRYRSCKRPKSTFMCNNIEVQPSFHDNPCASGAPFCEGNGRQNGRHFFMDTYPTRASEGGEHRPCGSSSHVYRASVYASFRVCLAQRLPRTKVRYEHEREQTQIRNTSLRTIK